MPCFIPLVELIVLSCFNFSHKRTTKAATLIVICSLIDVLYYSYPIFELVQNLVVNNMKINYNSFLKCTTFSKFMNYCCLID
jgi:hypothetical protein